MQPRRHSLTAPQRRRPFGQRHKRDLKSILGVVGMAQHSATDTQHSGAVTPYKFGERGLITIHDELPK
jgi:hypothetical protein